MQDVNGKLALITGAAGGIGLGMAKAFAAAGMRLVLADYDAEGVRRVSATLAAAGALVEPIELDVRDPDAWEDAARRIESRLGVVHVLCNNAGVGGGKIQLAELPPMLWKQIIDTNLNGVFFGVSTFARRMIAHCEGGHIVNTSSILGMFTVPGSGAYSAAKFGVTAISETLRAELAPHGIGVSVLFAGVVGTNFNENTSRLRQAMLPGLLKQFKTSTVRSAGTGRRMDPDRVGDRVLKAVLANELYIFTHPEYAQIIKVRNATLLAALGESAEPGYRDSDEILAAFSAGPYLFDGEK